MALQVSQVINQRYRIVKLLATGGFGAIYRAWDLQNNLPCALKENLDNSPESQRQFTEEADMLIKLNHPNLPRVWEHFVIHGQGQYLVMDFIEGDNLETMRLRSGGALSVNAVLLWIYQICDALVYLHSQNPPIIHRDIKPANILITSSGNAMLVDFGIAKRATGRNTTQGARGVTPGYSPPEQYTGAGTNERSDIYSLGATLYTLITGIELPESITRLIQQGVTQPPHLIAPGIPLHISIAIMQSINPDRQQRFNSISDFYAALSGISQKPGKFKIALPLSAIGIVGIVALLIIGIFLAKGFSDRPTPTRTTIAIAARPTSICSTVTPTKSPTPAETFFTPTVTVELPIAVIADRTTTPTLSVPETKASPTKTAIPVAEGMVYIPGGLFSMGATEAEMEWHLRSCNTYANCDRGDWTDMMPRHDVVLSPFYIDIYEVTNAQYRECIAAGKCSKPQQDRINRYLDSDYATSSAFNNYPVVAIAWSDAKNYCEWVGNKTLPTEAQWEFVAKGENDQFYPWVLRPSGTNARAVFDGSAPLANFCDKECPMENWKESKLDDGYVGPAPVGSYPPGPYGIYDMAGNVTEWILDVYSDDFYSKSSRNDPVFLDSGPWRVTRGGGWNNGFYGISSVVRSAQVPSDSKAFIGFRCVNEAP